MNLVHPSIEALRLILAEPDPGLALELDAFHGRGEWDPASQAERLLAITGELPAHVLHDAGGRPAIAFGLSFIRPGVLQTWFVARTGWTVLNPQLFDVHARLRAVVLAPATGIHRVQAVGLAGRPRVRPWFQRLGYVLEGVQARAGAQGEDFDLYALFGEG